MIPTFSPVVACESEGRMGREICFSDAFSKRTETTFSTIWSIDITPSDTAEKAVFTKIVLQAFLRDYVGNF